MVEFSARTVTSSLDDGEQTIVFRVPAVSERTARRRARVNARIKGIAGGEVTDVEEVAQGDVPGQVIYEVEVTGQRG